MITTSEIIVALLDVCLLKDILKITHESVNSVLKDVLNANHFLFVFLASKDTIFTMKCAIRNALFGLMATMRVKFAQNVLMTVILAINRGNASLAVKQLILGEFL